ncbi:RidA family protein [Spirillospora sp. NBC_00431]
MTVRPIDNGNGLGSYTPAIVADGPFVFVSGQGSIVNGAYQPGSVYDETLLALGHVAELLEQAGSHPGLVLHCRVFLQDIADFIDFDRAYAKFFPEPRPARTTVQAAALPLGVRVEIDCTAAVRARGH